MQDSDRFNRQLALETAQSQEGSTRLEARTLRAEQRNYGSSTVYGKKALQGHLEVVSEVIRTRLGRISNGIAGEDYKLIADRIGEADPNVLALLTMKVVLDQLSMSGLQESDADRRTSKRKKVLFTHTNLTTAIGKAVQVELRLNYYQATDPGLFRQVTNRFHRSSGTHQKATVYQLQFNRNGIEWKTWSPTITHRIGAWLLDCLQRGTDWVSEELVSFGKKSRARRVVLSPEFKKFRERILERASELASCSWPMLCQPVDWSNDQIGGYLTAEGRFDRLVRTYSKVGSSLPQGDLPLQMLNNLQHQAYRLNRQVFEVAEYCFANFITIGQFRRDEHQDPPSRPAEGASEETIKAYKVARRELEDVNAQLEAKNWRTTETMFVARKFIDEDRIWIPWSCDYRGRIYPITHCLTPQGTDFDKAMFYFADEGPVNEYWLAFQVATTYGLDKATMDERVEWVRANTELISTIAQNPIDTISLWRDVEEPWCFLAACFEYFDCCIACTRETSGLPCGIDATCSGLQHLSAMTGDAVAAALVNVLPTDKPADGYKTVAEAAKQWLPEEYHQWLTRKVTKRTVMTTPYGVTRHSARGYIMGALAEAGCDTRQEGLLTAFTTAIYEKAMHKVFQGPVNVMSFLQQSALRLMKEGREALQWTTPSGFVVYQDCRKPLTERVQTQLMGVGKITSAIYTGPGPVNVDKHKACTAPNLVHSLDASLLHFVFSEWDKPFTVIHDCALGRSCDMDELGQQIRLHFAEMYKGDVLQDWAAQVGAFIPDDLIKGTLDIDQVNQSPYFFC